jgi:hypothetical protein
LDLAATSDDGKPGHYLGKQIASYNANGRTEGEGVAKLKRTRQGQREEEEGGKASAGERQVRRRKTAADIEADADQGQLLLWQWRYLKAAKPHTASVPLRSHTPRTACVLNGARAIQKSLKRKAAPPPLGDDGRVRGPCPFAGSRVRT